MTIAIIATAIGAAMLLLGLRGMAQPLRRPRDVGVDPAVARHPVSHVPATPRAARVVDIDDWRRRRSQRRGAA